jgi:ACS family hexuronate transporter-like MFS transporter
MLGLLWIVLWRKLYHPPETHPNLGERERAMILAAREEEARTESHAMGESAAHPGWGALLRRRETWGIILGRSLTDPVWFFVTDWFAIYLVSRGFTVEGALLGFWIPFLAADLGNFFGGGVSSWLVAIGWKVLAARRFIFITCGLGMALLAGAVYVNTLPLMVAFFAISTFAYAAWSTMGLSLASDLYPAGMVASVSGMGGTGAGVGTIISTYLIGWAADHYSFAPILVAGSLIPLVATVLVCWLTRARRA